MKKQLQSINSVYNKNPILKRLSDRAQMLTQLNHLLQQALPAQFSAHCRLANVKNNILVIHTDNPSLASLIRFQSPMLCKSLSEQLETEFRSIEIKVKPHHVALKPEASNTTSISLSAANCLERTAENLEEGTLKTAMEKLAKRYKSTNN
jgi:hypothetical protein